jgi:hypothetical protein
MQLIKSLVFIVLIILIISLFFPWVGIESRGLEIGGFSSKGTKAFGKPGLFHLILSGFFVAFLLINKVWSKRFAYFFGALNLAWAVRNFSLISACSGGICPEKYIAIYVMLFSSLLLLPLSLFMDYGKKIEEEDPS